MMGRRFSDHRRASFILLILIAEYPVLTRCGTMLSLHSISSALRPLPTLWWENGRDPRATWRGEATLVPTLVSLRGGGEQRKKKEHKSMRKDSKEVSRANELHGRLLRCMDVEAVFQAIAGKESELDPPCMATALHRIVRNSIVQPRPGPQYLAQLRRTNSIRQDERLHCLLTQAESQLGAAGATFAPRDLATLAWADAKRVAWHSGASASGQVGGATSVDTPVLGAVAREVERRAAETGLGAFSAQELATLAWAAGTTRSQHTLLSDVAAEVVARAGCGDAAKEPAGAPLADFKPQELKDLAWAAARVQVCAAPMLAAVAEAAARRPLATFKDQELCALVWGLAKAPVKSSDAAAHAISVRTLVAHAAKEIERRGAEQLGPLHLTELLQAVEAADLGAVAEKLFSIVEEFALAPRTAGRSGLARAGTVQLERFRPRELMMVLSAFAATGHGTDAFWAAASSLVTTGGEEMGLRTGERLQRMRGQELAGTLAAFARAGRLVSESEPEMLQVVATEICRRNLETVPYKSLEAMLSALGKHKLASQARRALRVALDARREGWEKGSELKAQEGIIEADNQEKEGKAEADRNEEKETKRKEKHKVEKRTEEKSNKSRGVQGDEVGTKRKRSSREVGGSRESKARDHAHEISRCAKKKQKKKKKKKKTLSV